MHQPASWPSVDPLGEALHFLRMSGVFYCRSEFSAPWGLALPPLQRCLMFHTALSSLQERDIPLAALAERLGYQSEAAFSRAFKRFVGMSPGAVRKQASSGAMEHDTTRGKSTA